MLKFLTYPIRAGIQMENRQGIHAKKLEKYDHVSILQIPQFTISIILVFPQFHGGKVAFWEDFQRVEIHQTRK